MTRPTTKYEAAIEGLGAAKTPSAGSYADRGGRALDYVTKPDVVIRDKSRYPDAELLWMAGVPYFVCCANHILTSSTLKLGADTRSRRAIGAEQCRVDATA
jgi:hypothetical protein